MLPPTILIVEPCHRLLIFCVFFSFSIIFIFSRFFIHLRQRERERACTRMIEDRGTRRGRERISSRLALSVESDLGLDSMTLRSSLELK